MLQHFREVAPEEEVKHEINQGYAECISLLCQEATKLDELLLHLPPSEQPIYEPNGTRSTAIYLQSHDAVLNYAYHVVARIMQLAGLLRELYNQATPDHKDECYKTELWVQILVEIAQGAEMRTSLTQVSWQRPNTQLPLRGMHCFRRLDLYPGSVINLGHFHSSHVSRATSRILCEQMHRPTMEVISFQNSSSSALVAGVLWSNAVR